MIRYNAQNLGDKGQEKSRTHEMNMRRNSEHYC